MGKEDEKIDVVDSNDVVIGETNVQEAHDESLLHRVIGVLLFMPNGQMVVQTGNKFDKYDIAAGGHIGAGENPDFAALRELEEELEVTVQLEKIFVFVPKEARRSHLWHVYQGRVSNDWKFESTEEVSAITFMTIEEVVNGMISNPDGWTFGFQNVMREYLRVMDSNLGSSLFTF